MEPTIDMVMAQASELHIAGKLGEAEERYRAVLARAPERLDALCGLGILESQTGRHAAALTHLPAEIVERSGRTVLLVMRAMSLAEVGDEAQAEKCFRLALEADPRCAEAFNGLGCIHLKRKRYLEAVAALKTAVQLKPAYAEAMYNLGLTLYQSDLFAEAAEIFGRATKLRAYPEARLNQGFAYRRMGDLQAAAASFRRSMLSRPCYPEAMHNLAAVLADLGRVPEAIPWLRRAVDADPKNAAAHSALAYLLNFDPGSTATDILAEGRRWDEKFGRPLAPTAPAWDVERTPDRRLRVGYVSPDFRSHAVCRFLLPLFGYHDRREVEVHAYSSVLRPDEMTERLRKCVDKWHDVADFTDEQAAERIREDRIDILVDLTMHMENHRLAVFARRPAPVQISWLAYPGTAGLEAIPCRLSDVRLDPAEDPGALRLRRPWFCYQPESGLPEVRPLPALSGNALTLGSLNTYRKMSAPVALLWARTMQAIRYATGREVRLVISCPPGAREGWVEFMAQQGISAGQMELVPALSYREYLEKYGEIDIGLDPFPHNGATTTCDALWMGVPVLAVRGNTPCGRLGETVLAGAGLEEWVAGTQEEFVQKAVRFARDVPALARLRGELRGKLKASPLMDAEGFAREVEELYRGAWRRWCAAG